MATVLEDSFQATGVLFEKIRQSMSHRIGYTTLNSLDVKTWQDFISTSMVVSFTADLLADKIVQDHYDAIFTYETPSTWWQMLKETKAPQWFVRRWPVRHTPHTVKKTVNFTRYNTYPMANVSIPKHVQFIKMLGDPAVYDEVTCD